MRKKGKMALFVGTFAGSGEGTKGGMMPMGGDRR